jgi:hypothetical protein
MLHWHVSRTAPPAGQLIPHNRMLSMRLHVTFAGHHVQLVAGPLADGTTTLHALGELQVRGTLFISTHSDTYNGMIIGESAREADMEVRLPFCCRVCTSIHQG